MIIEYKEFCGVYVCVFKVTLGNLVMKERWKKGKSIKGIFMSRFPLSGDSETVKYDLGFFPLMVEGVRNKLSLARDCSWDIQH